MTKLNFTLEVDKILNDNDCKLLGMDYNEEEICIVSYTDDGVITKEMYIAYRFMNPARLKRKLLIELGMLEPSGFPYNADNYLDF